MGKYATLEENTFYIKRLFELIGTGETHFTEEERVQADNWGSAMVDAYLGNVTIPTGIDTPILINEVALALSSHRLLRNLVVANAPNQDEHVNALRDTAIATLKDIRHGRISLILLDGSLHPDYVGPSDGHRFAPQNDVDHLRRFFTQINRPFEKMEHLTSEEAPENEQYTDPDYDGL
jgi:hypothetical protein